MEALESMSPGDSPVVVVAVVVATVVLLVVVAATTVSPGCLATSRDGVVLVGWSFSSFS